LKLLMGGNSTIALKLEEKTRSYGWRFNRIIEH